jgi:hypothetical protein
MLEPGSRDERTAQRLEIASVRCECRKRDDHAESGKTGVSQLTCAFARRNSAESPWPIWFFTYPPRDTCDGLCEGSFPSDDAESARRSGS